MGLLKELWDRLWAKPMVEEWTPEVALNKYNACPDCESVVFHLGPSGGVAQNIMCAGCGSQWNFCPPFEPQRINNPDHVYGHRCFTWNNGDWRDIHRGQ